LHLVAQKPIKKLYSNFFGVEVCAVDHPCITIIKEEEEEVIVNNNKLVSFLSISQAIVFFWYHVYTKVSYEFIKDNSQFD
jgi:hypothetical protein